VNKALWILRDFKSVIRSFEEPLNPLEGDFAFFKGEIG